jgi:O-antigen/teichoic acid export membrane protein
MVAMLFGMRLVITPVVGVVAVLYTVVAGYDQVLVLGTAMAVVGHTLFAASSALAMPLSVDLKIVSLTALELVKQLGLTIVIVVLVLLGTGLLPFFAAAIPGAFVALVLTPALAGRAVTALPSFEFRAWGRLLHRSLPIAFATVVGVVYTRFLAVIVFQLSSDEQTGLFGTSARILEAIGGLPLLAFMVALPVLSQRSDQQRDRVRNILQLMVQVALLGACMLATVLVLGADVIIAIVGGAEYREAVPVLQIQSFSLIGSLLATACLMAAIAVDERRTILLANTLALVTVVAFGVPAVIWAGAQGAAIAAVAGESALGLGYWYLLGRGGVALRPRLRSAWKPLVAMALSVVVAELSGFGDYSRPAVGVLAFVVLALCLRAVPSELFAAFRRNATARF